MESDRIKLIERLCRLPESQLPCVKELFDQFELRAPPIISPAFPIASRSDWPHAPTHQLSEHGTFIVTASTLQRDHIFRTAEKLTWLESHLLKLANEFQLQLEAWAVFSNHYHFVAHTSGEANQLARFLTRFHSQTADEINRRDGTPGRKVWYNYWDTRLTFEKSYFARLNYVHQNAVKHGLVKEAKDYPWCSAAWFEATATPAQVKTIYRFKYDRVQVEDDYDPVV